METDIVLCSYNQSGMTSRGGTSGAMEWLTGRIKYFPMQGYGIISFGTKTVIRQ